VHTRTTVDAGENGSLRVELFTKAVEIPSTQADMSCHSTQWKKAAPPYAMGSP